MLGRSAGSIGWVTEETRDVGLCGGDPTSVGADDGKDAKPVNVEILLIAAPPPSVPMPLPSETGGEVDSANDEVEALAVVVLLDAVGRSTVSVGRTALADDDV